MSIVRRNPNFTAGVSNFLLDQVSKGKAGEDIQRQYVQGNIEFIDMSFKVRFKLGAIAASSNATVNIIDTTLARTEGRTDLHQGILPGKMAFAISAIRLAYAETAGLPETGVYRSRLFAAMTMWAQISFLMIHMLFRQFVLNCNLTQCPTP